jgi:hypothetical protein
MKDEKLMQNESFHRISKIAHLLKDIITSSRDENASVGEILTALAWTTAPIFTATNNPEERLVSYIEQLKEFFNVIVISKSEVIQKKLAKLLADGKLSTSLADCMCDYVNKESLPEEKVIQEIAVFTIATLYSFNNSHEKYLKYIEYLQTIEKRYFELKKND